jgi:hypothetical protein
MSKFNLTNYESYYIDYLEGNLSEGDRHAFELFLDQHPALQLEGELPVFTIMEDENLSYDFINQLRVFDEKEKVNENTIDGFLIASTEGILSTEKQQELQAYLLKNPSHLDSLGMYHKTKLSPDIEIRYPNKQGLRKGNTRRLIFGVVSGVAAVFVGVILLFPSQEMVYHQANKQLVKSNRNNPYNKIKKTQTPSQEFLCGGNETPIISSTNQTTSKSELAQQPVDSDTNLLIVQQELLTIEEPNQLQTISKTKEVENTEYLAFSAMKSPVDPIFKLALKNLRDKVDLRYAKATETKQGGFYLKLWNFEVSRKVSAIGDLAVK